MPLRIGFITSEQSHHRMLFMMLMRLLGYLIVLAVLFSCGTTRWHSIQEVPAEATAYLKGGVYVSDDYVRNAVITKIDDKNVNKLGENHIEIELGIHQVTILCAEARGEFDSIELAGKEKTLTFKAKIQRSYIARCLPYTHWWIEDVENNQIVAGEKPINI